MTTLPRGIFADLEAELAEDSRTVAASEVESLSDLDALLEESLDIAAATKAKKQGRKLTAGQQELLEANRLAEMLTQWKLAGIFAHIEIVKCSCGEETQVFRGWYRLEHHIDGKKRRLVRQGFSPEEAGAEKPRLYITDSATDTCAHCLLASGKLFATAADCDLLSTLCRG